MLGACEREHPARADHHDAAVRGVGRDASRRLRKPASGSTGGERPGSVVHGSGCHFPAAIKTATLFAMPADHRDEAERSEAPSTPTASDVTRAPAQRRSTGDPERLAAQSIQRAKDKFSIVVTLGILAALVVLTISVAISDVVTAREPSHSGTFTLAYIDGAGRGPDIM